MYYFVYFDPKEGTGKRQIVEAYKKFADHFEKRLPHFKLVGLYARNVLLGSRPHYTAIWEFPDYSNMEEWNKAFAKDTGGQKLAKRLADLASGWEAKVMTKLL